MLSSLFYTELGIYNKECPWRDPRAEFKPFLNLIIPDTMYRQKKFLRVEDLLDMIGMAIYEPAEGKVITVERSKLSGWFAGEKQNNKSTYPLC